MKELIREIVYRVLAEGDETPKVGSKLEWGDLDSLPKDAPVSVGIASRRQSSKSTGSGSPKWRYIETTAGQAQAVARKARKSPGFYDSSVSYGHKRVSESNQVNISDLMSDRWQDPYRVNALPEKSSNWYALAKHLDIGVTDLDLVAADLGYYNFYDLDISISPQSLINGAKRQDLLTSLRNNVTGDGATDEELTTTANLPYEYHGRDWGLD